MSEQKNIKLNEQEFNNAITKLTEYRNILINSKDNFICVNENMKKDWIGDGGTAFALSSNVLEARLSETINNLNEEIKKLEEAKELLFNLDNKLARALTNSISSAVSHIAAEAGKRIK